MPIPRTRTINLEGLGARRGIRRPQHRWYTRSKPFQITPTMIAPVLPGETLQNFLMQVRAICKPMKNALLGAHLCHHFYYVKLRDLNDRDAIVAALIDPAVTLEGSNFAPLWDEPEWRERCYYNATADCTAQRFMPWMQLCLDRIIMEYFRAEGEAINIGVVDEIPLVSIDLDDIFDSVELESNMPAALDLDVDLNADSTITANEVKTAMRQFELMQEMGFADGMTYEEFLGTFGVRTDPEELHRPEELRYSKEWSYPAALFDPSTGLPASMFSWKTALRADKKRFFKEHGFIVGLSYMRPKVLLGEVLQSSVGLLRNTRQWLPALLRDDTATSMLRLGDPSNFMSAFSAPTVACTTPDAVPVWIDVADLYRYGDQLLGIPLTATDAGLVALPTADIQKRYVNSADINGLFTGVTDAARMIEQDGIVQLQVSTQSAPRDNTVTTINRPQ